MAFFTMPLGLGSRYLCGSSPVDGFLRSVNAGQRVEYMSSIVCFTTAAHLLSTPQPPSRVLPYLNPWRLRRSLSTVYTNSTRTCREQGAGTRDLGAESVLCALQNVWNVLLIATQKQKPNSLRVSIGCRACVKGPARCKQLKKALNLAWFYDSHRQPALPHRWHWERK